MISRKNKVLVVCGPTASGKTKLAVDLALLYNAEVVSADSMQIYKEMNIGTAKPTKEEMRGVKHHLIDFLPPGQEFSVVEYSKLAQQRIEEIHAKGKLPILAGGTGLYINSVINNLDYANAPHDDKVRQELLQQTEELGKAQMLNRLMQIDPQTAAELHENNIGRILRALEVYELTRKTMSYHKEMSRKAPSPYDVCMIGISYRERQNLYGRINLRVDKMLADGLLNEAQELLNKCGKTAMQAIGYKELALYFEGLQTLEQAAEKLKMDTRRYAKRQLTWFKKDERVNWVYNDDYTDYKELVADAVKIVDEHLAL